MGMLEVPAGAGQSPVPASGTRALGEAGSDLCSPVRMFLSLPEGVEMLEQGMLGKSVLGRRDVDLGFCFWSWLSSFPNEQMCSL